MIALDVFEYNKIDKAVILKLYKDANLLQISLAEAKGRAKG